MIWFDDLFDREKAPTFSPLGTSPGMENEYWFFKTIEGARPAYLKSYLSYYREKGITFKPQYLEAIERQIRKGDFENPHKFPDYFDGEFDFISMAFQFVNSPPEIVCNVGLAFVKNGELVHWTNYYILPPDEEDALLLPKGREVRPHEIVTVQNFRRLWDSTLSEICNNNLLVIYDSVVELGILKTLFLNYGIESFSIWYTDVLGLLELSGNYEKYAQLGRECGFKVNLGDNVCEDAVTCANVFHELSKGYPNYRNHVRHLNPGNYQ